MPFVKQRKVELWVTGAVLIAAAAVGSVASKGVGDRSLGGPGRDLGTDSGSDSSAPLRADSRAPAPAVH